MTVLLFGAAALLLHVFLLGALWPHRAPQSFGVSLWGYMTKALLISWFWFSLSFFTPLGTAAPILVLLLIGVASFRIASGAAPLWISKVEAKGLSSWVWSAIFLAIVAFMSLPALKTSGSTFTVWDAVVSWNRWALELYRNTYTPMPMAYPILWPAIWSLIYEAQNSIEQWYFAKASLFVPPVLLAVYAADQVRTGKIISGLFLAALLYMLFLSNEALANGYMDFPVALIGLGGLLMIVEALKRSPEDPARTELLLFAALSVSAAMLTKQHGAAFVFAFALVCAALFLKKELALGTAFFWGALIAVPYGIFLLMYLAVQSDILGVYDYLRQLSASRRGEEGELAYALGVLKPLVPLPALVLLSTGVIANLVFVRSRVGVFGIVCILIAAGGFIAYADCCSYNWRNGVWLLSFLTVSAWIGFTQLCTWVACVWPRAWKLAGGRKLNRINGMAIGAFIVAYLAAFSILSIVWPADKVVLRHQNQQNFETGYPYVNNFIMSHKEIINRHSHIISYYGIMAFMPGITARYLSCPRTSRECIVRYLPNANPLLVLSANHNETDETRAFIDEALSRKLAVKLVSDGNLTLFEFTGVP